MTNVHRRRVLRAGLAAGVAIVAAGRNALAQEFPRRTIRLIVPWAAGGLVDTGARVLTEPLGKSLRQPVVVENLPGAAGNIGGDTVAKAAPDGHTLLMGTSSLAIDANRARGLAYDPARDLAPVALVAAAPSVVVVHPDFPAKDIRELIALAKAKPGELSYGTPGTGSPANLFTEQFRSMAGVDILHVPYSRTPAVNDLIGGRLSLMFATIAVAMPHIRSGKLRVLAVTGAKRFPGLPDVPTVAESGLPGYEAGQWLGVLAPAGTPATTIHLLNAEITRAVRSDPVEKALEFRGMEPLTGTPEDFARIFAAEVQRWGAVIRTSGIKLE